MSPWDGNGWTDPAVDDIAAYDPEDVKHPEYLDRILDGGDD